MRLPFEGAAECDDPKAHDVHDGVEVSNIVE